MADGSAGQDDGRAGGDALTLRIAQLRQAAQACRRSWRWQFGRFWLLRWENTLRRPSWRLDEENNAWRQMRAEVRRYAELRRQLAELSALAAGRGDSGVAGGDNRMNSPAS